MRAAISRPLDLSGCDLYTSCEPCSVCVSTMMIAGIAACTTAHRVEQSDRVVPAPAAAAGPTLVRAQVGLPVRGARQMPAEQKLDGEAIAVLEAWVKKQEK